MYSCFKFVWPLHIQSKRSWNHIQIPKRREGIQLYLSIVMAKVQKGQIFISLFYRWGRKASLTHGFASQADSKNGMDSRKLISIHVQEIKPSDRLFCYTVIFGSKPSADLMPRISLSPSAVIPLLIGSFAR